MQGDDHDGGYWGWLTVFNRCANHTGQSVDLIRSQLCSGALPHKQLPVPSNTTVPVTINQHSAALHNTNFLERKLSMTAEEAKKFVEKNVFWIVESASMEIDGDEARSADFSVNMCVAVPEQHLVLANTLNYVLQ